jgi:plastocyanin
VHAGGGVADISGNCSISGAITSNYSYGEYVVSAKSAVSGFGSNNSSGSTSATLGSAGNYGFVCRPDLVTKATNYISANVSGLGFKTVPASFSMSDAVFDADGVYYRAGDVTITGGSYTHKITLYVTGTVNITGSISLSSSLSTTGKDQKSFGLIAKNGINIYGAATQVDAYLFSDGTINTCVEASFARCSNTLTVNGFLMASTMSFQRLGPPNAGIVVGEQANMTGQLYVNPPALFGSLLDASLLIQQGERPTLY